MAVHVRCKSLYISLPSPMLQQRILENTKMAANFSYVPLELNAGVTYLAQASAETE